MESIHKDVNISGEPDTEREFSAEFRFVEDSNGQLVERVSSGLQYHVKFFPIAMKDHITMILRRLHGANNIEVPTHYCVVRNVDLSQNVHIALLFDPIFGIARQRGAPTTKMFAGMVASVALAFQTLSEKRLVVVKPKDHQIIRVNTQYYLAWSVLFADVASLPKTPMASIVVDVNQAPIAFANPIFHRTQKSDMTTMLLREIDPREGVADDVAQNFCIESSYVPDTFVPHIITCMLLAQWNAPIAVPDPNAQERPIDFLALEKAARSYYAGGLSDFSPSRVIEHHLNPPTHADTRYRHASISVQARLPTGETCTINIGAREEIEFYKKIIDMPAVCDVVLPAVYHGTIAYGHNPIGVTVLRDIGGMPITEAQLSEIDPIGNVHVVAINAINALNALRKETLHHGFITPGHVRVYTHNGNSIYNLRLCNFSESNTTSAIPSPFMPPELHQGHSNDAIKADIWALGVCLTKLMHYLKINVAYPEFLLEYNPNMFMPDNRVAAIRSIDQMLEQLKEVELGMQRIPVLHGIMKAMLAYDKDERYLPDAD